MATSSLKRTDQNTYKPFRVIYGHPSTPTLKRHFVSECSKIKAAKAPPNTKLTPLTLQSLNETTRWASGETISKNFRTILIVNTARI